MKQSSTDHFESPGTLTRRSVIGAGVAAAVSLTVTHGPTSAQASPEAIRELPQPELVRSVDGVLDTTLIGRPGVVDMGVGQPVSTYTFGGKVPGDTWELNPGDTLRVRLQNDLPQIESDQHTQAHHTGPHDWTTMNLHTHGLHVSPKGNSDNVFLSVAPGGTQQYEIHIPDDHPAGFHWYHPHRHGAVAQQLRAGLAGAIIVRGDLDEVPEIAAANEQVMVLQAIELGDDFTLQDPIPNPTKEQAFFPRSKVLYTINGVLNPSITMYPGEVQRWRMVNAAEGKFMSLKVSGHDMHVLAWDGLTLAEPEANELVMMSAGNRVEALIKAGEPGIYHLMLTPGSSQKPNIPGMPDEDRESSSHDTTAMTAMAPMSGFPEIPGELDIRSILTIEVVGEGPEMQLPTSLPAWDPPMLPIARHRSFAFTVERTPENEFLSFGVDGAPYSPERPLYQVKIGTAEEWTLYNGLDAKLADHAHVFHIHVNPYKITKINGETLEKPIWRDTWVLTRKTGDSFTFESNFVDFTGAFVGHCHIVSHEDLGMMEAVEVIE